MYWGFLFSTNRNIYLKDGATSYLTVLRYLVFPFFHGREKSKALEFHFSKELWKPGVSEIVDCCYLRRNGHKNETRSGWGEMDSRKSAHPVQAKEQANQVEATALDSALLFSALRGFHARRGRILLPFFRLNSPQLLLQRFKYNSVEDKSAIRPGMQQPQSQSYPKQEPSFAENRVEERGHDLIQEP